MASKPGDWKCGHCGENNFASRSCCYVCKRRKPIERKPGDWDCSCGAVNFSSKLTCHICAKPKPGVDAGAAVVNNDWSCTACGFSNFRRNDKCKKCGTEKSFKDIVEAKLKEVETLKKRAREKEVMAEENLKYQRQASAETRAVLEKELDSVRRLGTAESQMCAICTDKPKNAICLPCHHIFACMDCVKRLQTCSLCRAPIESINQVYL